VRVEDAADGGGGDALIEGRDERRDESAVVSATITPSDVKPASNGASCPC